MRAVGLALEYVQRAPHGFGQLLQVIDLYLSAPREIAIVGDPADPGTGELIMPPARDSTDHRLPPSVRRAQRRAAASARRSWTGARRPTW